MFPIRAEIASNVLNDGRGWMSVFNWSDTSMPTPSALKSPAIWACLGVYPLDMPRTPYRASEGKRSQ